MKTLIKLIFIYTAILSTALAQDTSAVFFEKGPANMVRFFYDFDYYLVAKNCDFKAIERVADFDVRSNKFNGSFKDFDNNGRTLLSGSYKNGNKEGEFTAYYPNGALKWKTTFLNDLINGSLEYFYPDGKPMLSLTLYNGNAYINKYWNKFGEQTVVDGQGSLDITLPIVGYTEHGFTKYKTNGKVNNGLREGLWHTSFIYGDKDNQYAPLMVSAYENGQLREREVDVNFEGMLIDFNRFTFAPIESFSNAELLQSKKCSFDEHTGFNSFIADKFKDFLTKTSYKTDVDKTIGLTYTIRVTKKGTPYAHTVTETSVYLNKSEQFLFKSMIDQIYYYLPSYLNNEAITDRLTISLEIQTNGDIINIPPVQIVREKGF